MIPDEAGIPRGDLRRNQLVVLLIARLSGLNHSSASVRAMERRAVQRTRTAALVECRVRGRSELAETYDISTDGCMLQASNGFCDAGDDIELVVGGVLVRGTVVWAKHRNAGVQFAGTVSADTLAAITAAADQPRSLALASAAHPTARRIQLAIYGLLALASTLLLLSR